ncbi:hypothetical protein SAMD00019534_071280, partial [Acytostelium subglobosum LB1]|uniref:hypothetical protein n=1 Tax=Acytostelium subglobosum LB1 TaxID=1410327 RepID=UPI0006448004
GQKRYSKRGEEGDPQVQGWSCQEEIVVQPSFRQRCHRFRKEEGIQHPERSKCLSNIVASRPSLSSPVPLRSLQHWTLDHGGQSVLNSPSVLHVNKQPAF